MNLDGARRSEFAMGSLVEKKKVGKEGIRNDILG